MQIVEAAEGWVRVAELRLRRRGTPLEFVLYPMFHVGLPEFYAEVNRRLAGVDVVVLEGVRGSRVGPGLASGYLELARDPRTGLVRQWTEIPPDAVVVRPDSPGAEFDERWRTVPLVQRAAVWLGVGYVRAGHRLLGSGWHLDHVRGAAMDDLPTNEEILDEEILEDVDRVMLHERDERLLQAIATLHEQRSHEAVTVAVLWGAAHMRAVVHGLGERGYRVYAAEWLTVIDS
jgi:hypothetical protein